MRTMKYASNLITISAPPYANCQQVHQDVDITVVRIRRTTLEGAYGQRSGIVGGVAMILHVHNTIDLHGTY